MSAKSKADSLLDDLKLHELTMEAVASAAGTAFGEGAKALIADLAGPWAPAMQETVKALAGGLAAPLLGALLRVSSDRTARLLARVVAEPYATGARVIEDALAPPTQGTAAFLQERLTFGINKLEEAFSLVRGTPRAEAQEFQIRLMQGLAARVMSGGVDYARRRLSECLGRLDSWLDADNRAIVVAEKRLSTLEKRLDEADRLADPGRPPGNFMPSHDVLIESPESTNIGLDLTESRRDISRLSQRLHAWVKIRTTLLGMLADLGDQS
jgi:hypothetical protein